MVVKASYVVAFEQFARAGELENPIALQSFLRRRITSKLEINKYVRGVGYYCIDVSSRK
jgi:hypothetical protein